jgi:hypothetical protein
MNSANEWRYRAPVLILAWLPAIWQIGAGLLTWRNRCRLNGQKFLAEIHAAATARPRQLELSFNQRTPERNLFDAPKIVSSYFLQNS